MTAFSQQLAQVEQIKAALRTEPEALHAARSIAVVAGRELSAAKKRLGEIEAAIDDATADIASLVAGDQVFKNEPARKAEVRRRAKDDATIRALESQRQEAESRVLQAEVAKSGADLDVKRQEDTQRAWRSRLDALALEVQLLVAGR